MAALVLAKKGLKVLVVEERDTIGGAARTERPFARAPGLAASTGAQLLGLMPPSCLTKLGSSSRSSGVTPTRSSPAPAGKRGAM